MQTNLDKNGIDKRKELTVKNAYVISDEYGVKYAKKSGNETGSLVDHTLSTFDTTSGGDKTDISERKKQSLYSPKGLNRYGEGRGYGEQIKIEISDSEGQYIIN
jgi:hypothetical protein